ncbi:MAG: cellulose synthase family protein [Polyangiaceae bacterium]|jgi:cellulose synthase/poly-beta-1,6-N-acetylglucosamine synthase-like glycosyltransferase
MSVALCLLYATVLAILSVYGVHRSFLVFMARRLRVRLAELKKGVPPLSPSRMVEGSTLPHVTVQLPLYNESTVVHRLLETVSKIEYPRDKLEIQVLDDSTDETTELARRSVDGLRAAGLDIVLMHRVDRIGYKAGALEAGLRVAKGELVALFDADFVPPPDFLRAVIPHFDDADVAMVQTRWVHLNRSHSILTRVAALMLDGHHLIENRVRAGAGWLFNFAGTGGIWRKRAIESAGGWQHDTLTEDLDLSYRAQLMGWRFVYREDIVTPAELPEEVSAFRAQQFRWATGTVQTQRKLLRRVLRSHLSFGARTEAFFHLTPHFAYPLTMLLSVILLPLVLLLPATNSLTVFAIDIPLFFGTTGSLAVFYAMAERAQGRRARDALIIVPALIGMGVGLTPLVTRALVRGYRSMAGEFVRTPKKGSAGASRYRSSLSVPIAESLLCVVSLASTIASIHSGHFVATPFAALFTAGYGYMAGAMLLEQMDRTRPTFEPARGPGAIAEAERSLEQSAAQ